jgi:uncharacterized protein (DUF1778 family)
MEKVYTTCTEKGEQIVRAYIVEEIILSKEEQESFWKTIQNPPAPGKNLQEALRKAKLTTKK